MCSSAVVLAATTILRCRTISDPYSMGQVVGASADFTGIEVGHEGSGGTKWAGEANAIRCALTLMSELDFAFSLISLHERNPWRNPLKFLLIAFQLEAV